MDQNTKRTNLLPPPKTIPEAIEVCLRNARNATMNLIDCEDCQDCSESEIHIYEMQRAEWVQLGADLYKIHLAQHGWPNEKIKADLKEASKLKGD